jgi:hypothetical protein
MKFNWSENKTEYKIGLWSLIAFLLIWFIALIFGFPAFPVGYLAKLPFAGIAVITFWLLVWFIMEKSRPILKELIDPDTITNNIKQCTPFQKLLYGFFWFALLFWGMVEIASRL